jgi:ATP-binding cassette, subfamily B, bacterial PglK
MNSLFKVFKILDKKQQRHAGYLIILMVIGGLLEAIGIGAIYPLINMIGNSNYLNDHETIRKLVLIFKVTTHKQLILFSTIFLILIYFIKNLFILFESWLQLCFSTSNQRNYTNRLYAWYIKKPYLYHVYQNSANLVRNITAGGKLVFDDMLISVLSMITEAITAFIIWLMIAIIDWQMAVVVAAILLILVFFIFKIFKKKISKLGEIQNDCMASYLKWLYQGLGAIKETKVMQKEKYFTNQFMKSYSEYTDALRTYSFIDKIPKAIIEFISIFALTSIIIFKISIGVNPSSIVPSLGLVALAAIRMMPSANRVISLANRVKVSMPLFNEMYDDLFSIKNNVDKKDKVNSESDCNKLAFTSEISVNGISFSYPNKMESVLQNISFKIPKGSFVGIVGPSGAGKTTFVDILLGLLQPKSGTITVDGIDTKKKLSSWLYDISYVPQSIYLIDGSIKENIALGIEEKNIDDENINKVLKMAELYDFVCSLPEGLNTRVGERGAMLSGGQKQRIGIARALYNQPAVLILDEATSALDNATEKSITDTILKLKGQITIISIAHRISTLDGCDFKIKFENGKAEIIKNSN